ncbi:hypothetical protein F8S12_34290 [Nostoc sp. WHI]|nr:hypothetical protein [Nostoc sp. WHI]
MFRSAPRLQTRACSPCSQQELLLRFFCENLKQVFPLVPNSPCPQVLLPMPNAQCPIPNYFNFFRVSTRFTTADSAA